MGFESGRYRCDIFLHAALAIVLTTAGVGFGEVTFQPYFANQVHILLRSIMFTIFFPFQLDISNEYIALIFCVYAGVYVIAAPILGPVTDKIVHKNAYSYTSK